MISRIHNGIRFQVWNSQRTWFWLTVNEDRRAGAIGVAASEAEAIDEARRSISEVFNRESTCASGAEGRERILVCT
jgi:hypothetical protein